MNKAGILPFGYMSEKFNRALAGPPPTSWRAGAEPLEDWIERILATIKDEVWPVWNHASRKWEGRAESTGIELSKADLESMAVLSRHFREPSRQGRGDNNWWFWKEDDLFPDAFFEERFREILGGIDDLNTMFLLQSLKILIQIAASPRRVPATELAPFGHQNDRDKCY